MKDIIGWLQHLIDHLRHHDDPQNHPAPATPLPPPPAILVAPAPAVVVPATPANAIPDATMRMLGQDPTKPIEADPRGVTPEQQAQAQIEIDREAELEDFNPDNPASVRHLHGAAGQSITKGYPAKESGRLELDIGEKPGNEAAQVDVHIMGPGVDVTWPGCHLVFNDKVPGIQAGQRYTITITAAAKFELSLRAGLLQP